MRIFLQAGFGIPIGAETLDLIQALGFAGIRQGIDGLPSVVDQVLGEFRGRPLGALLTVGVDGVDPATVVHRAAYAAREAQRLRLPDFAIEVGNEPDASQSYRGLPLAWGHLVRQVAEALPGVHVVSGGITSTSVQGLNYLRSALAEIPSSVTIGIHTYRSGPPDKPLPGYLTRGEEFTVLRGMVGARRVWCTEVGWSDFEKHGGLIPAWCGRRLSPSEVAANLRREFELCAAAGCEVGVVFQLNDGLGRDEHFGIRWIDGNLKPSALVAQEE